MPRLRHVLLVLALVPSSVLAWACGAKKETKKSDDDACSPEGATSCKDEHTLRRCKDGELVTSHCKGPRGCMKEGGEAACDDSASSEGGPCDVENAIFCSADGKELLRCRGGRLAVESECVDSGACETVGGTPQCHGPVAKPGAPCFKAGACSVDQKSILTCRDGRFADEADCVGPRGCYFGESLVKCDDAVSQVGKPCSVSAVCAQDRKRILICDNGFFAAGASCVGATGCSGSSGATACDEPRAKVGEPCHSGGACSEDKKEMLLCTDNHFAVEATCTGPKGCRIEDKRVKCDGPTGQLGGACTNGAVCSADGKMLLKCNEKIFVVESLCPGPAGCHAGAKGLDCDGVASVPGSPCSNGAACTPDGKDELQCKDGKFVTWQSCTGAKGCRVESHKVLCDDPVGEVGGPCSAGTCSRDHKHVLECKAGKRAEGKACPNGCNVITGSTPRIDCH
jgi:hypothetical protein